MNSESRYIRQINLPQVGQRGQDKLGASRILVVGAGGLGHALLPYLAAAGLGTLAIIDGDKVARSNLHRQVLFRESDIGQKKVNVVYKGLAAINPEITIHTFPEYLTAANAIDLFDKYDLIVDATDNISARYLINDACVLAGKAFVHAAIYRFQVQVSVFNYRGGATYRCLYPHAPMSAQSCAEAGIMGTSVAHAGSLQANEVIKIILGKGEVLSGKVLIADLLANTQKTFTFKKNNSLKITPNFFYKEHAAVAGPVCFAALAPEAVKNTNKIIYLDVRRPAELPTIEHDKVVQIPLDELKKNLHRLSKDTDYYIFCQSGKRSRQAIKLLTENDFKNMYLLAENAEELKKLL